MQAAQEPLEQKLKNLTEALAFETKRREAVERLAVDAFKRRRELEATLAGNEQAEKALQRQMETPDGAKRRRRLEIELVKIKRAQAQLRQELEASQKQLRAQKENDLAEQSKLEANTRALQSAQAEVAQKVKRLTETLAGETKGGRGDEQQSSEAAKQSNRSARRGPLSAVREFMEDKIRLLTTRRREGLEQGADGHSKHGGQQDATPAHRQEAKGTVPQKVETSPKQLQAQQETSRTEPSSLETQAQQLQADRANVLQRIKRLTDTLAEETRRRQGAEKQASESRQQRGELQAELLKINQAQVRLRQELEASQKQLGAQQTGSRAEQNRLEGRIKELQAAQPEVEQQVKRLTEMLAAETKRREAAEQRAAQLARTPE